MDKRKQQPAQTNISPEGLVIKSKSVVIYTHKTRLLSYKLLITNNLITSYYTMPNRSKDELFQLIKSL
ncbi:MAG: hypothetical protein ACOVOS_05340, partial [Chitinophagaceae bacterium]